MSRMVTVGQERVDGGGAVAHQARRSGAGRAPCRFRPPWLAATAQAGVDQRMVHGARGEQRVNRQPAFGDGSRSDSTTITTPSDGGDGVGGQLADGAFQIHGWRDRSSGQTRAARELRFSLRHHQGELLGEISTGERTSTRLACSGDSSNMLRSGPKQVFSDITTLRGSGRSAGWSPGQTAGAGSRTASAPVATAPPSACRRPSSPPLPGRLRPARG